ncbi:DUF2809 domain-containing protein [Lacihabitans soyangensis]|uniref:DUF2809 domain-containing protein n=2 Tax=Lacihabitans soyangensis TaxID=869394 RepID=A0AAE3H1F2_9BACT|nr:DUF2809 domain-containing protein [Lacihabitans soyangensis]
MHFHMKYPIASVVLLAVEICIAVFIHDQFIRPFFGDFLAVIFVYCGLRIFNQNILKTALLSLLIAYFIEILQYFKFIEITGLIKYKVLAILIGNSFSWLDILAYTLGFVFILLIENFEILRILCKLQFETTKKR